MKLAFILFKYFPFGGLQRDMRRIAEACQARGHEIHIYTLSWLGEIPEGFNVHILPIKRLSNHRRYSAFHAELQRHLKEDAIDGTIGFNRMPGLDLYYAADPCFREKVYKRNPLIRLMPRYRHFLDFEEAVFGQQSKTELLMIAKPQMQHYQQHYQTQPERMTLLPPGISRDRMAPSNAAEVRQSLRAEFGLKDDDLLLVSIGSGFKTKGLNRSLQAVAALPDELRQRTHLYAMGNDNPKPHIKRAKQLGLSNQFKIMPGRDDVPRFLQGADLLLHPAFYESAGMVLLEAIIAGLPVLTTDTCGYASHIEQAGCGSVITSPFQQSTLNEKLEQMLNSSERDTWRANGIRYGQSEDLYSMPEIAADLVLKRVAAK
jgi:UDP-glucose:(heptosyl)LPS alpha-1,3-glucosyltransferase